LDLNRSGLNLTTQLNLALRLRVTGAIDLLPTIRPHLVHSCSLIVA